MRSSLVSPQVRMLLERMDMCPEEFVASELDIGMLSRQSKWYRLLNDGEFNVVEKVLIHHKYKKLKRAATRTAIMDIILNGGQEDPQVPLFSTTGRFNKPPPQTMVDLSVDANGNTHEVTTIYK